MGSPPGSSPVDLPDPLETSDDLTAGSTEDLLSQLAGDQIDRLMSGQPRRAIDPDQSSGPVEQLTNQLDNFFEELLQREGQPVEAPAPRLQQLEEQDDLSPTQEELDSLHGIAFAPPRALFPPRPEPAPEPAYLRPLNWLSDPIESLPTGARWAVGIAAIVCFLAGCGALAYVLMLRQT
jgi:hypothetical protein